jgi:hypothetical protein
LSNRKSSRRNRRRFSGPELGDVLSEVVTEHGTDATIAAVNRVRSGGVAGFFCREEFEVIVNGAAGAASGTPSRLVIETAEPDPGPAPEPQSTPAPASASASASDSAPAQDDGVIAPGGAPDERILDGDAQADARFRALVEQRLADRTDDEATRARLADRALDAEAPAPKPEEAAGTGPSAAIDPVLAIALATTQPPPGIVGAPRPAPSNPPVEPSPVPHPAASLPVPSPASLPVAPVPPPLVPDERLVAPVASADGSLVRRPLSMPVGSPSELLTDEHAEVHRFWLEVRRAQHELASFMPLDAASVAVLGPLAPAARVLRRLRSRPAEVVPEVFVLTDRAGIVSEPSWHLVRSGHRLEELVEERRPWPSLILVDVPGRPPSWLVPMLHRLREAGVGLFRQVVPGSPSMTEMRQLLAPDLPVALDVAERLDPSVVAELIDARLPLASVGGVEICAELLVAIRRQAER